MRQSEKINELVAALVSSQKKFPIIHKNKTMSVPGRKEYHYADLADILQAVVPVLTTEGLTISQMADFIPEAGFVLTTRLMHISGQWIEGAMPLGDGKQRAQDLGSLLTYYRRYAICAVLGIQADDDDDGAGAHDAHHAAPPKVSSRPHGIPAPQSVDPLIKAQIDGIRDRLKGIGMDIKAANQFIAEKTKKFSASEITTKDIAHLNAEIDKELLHGWDTGLEPTLPMPGKSVK